MVDSNIHFTSTTYLPTEGQPAVHWTEGPLCIKHLQYLHPLRGYIPCIAVSTYDNITPQFIAWSKIIKMFTKKLLQQILWRHQQLKLLDRYFGKGAWSNRNIPLAKVVFDSSLFNCDAFLHLLHHHHRYLFHVTLDFLTLLSTDLFLKSLKLYFKNSHTKLFRPLTVMCHGKMHSVIWSLLKVLQTQNTPNDICSKLIDSMKDVLQLQLYI